MRANERGRGRPGPLSAERDASLRLHCAPLHENRRDRREPPRHDPAPPQATHRQAPPLFLNKSSDDLRRGRAGATDKARPRHIQDESSYVPSSHVIPPFWLSFLQIIAESHPTARLRVPLDSTATIFLSIFLMPSGKGRGLLQIAGMDCLVPLWWIANDGFGRAGCAAA